MDSAYDNAEYVRSAVERGLHRDVIGGLWDEIGRLQFEFMLDVGLQPHHKLLDLGCGSLRGGVHFVKYLDPGNYYGVDLNASLLDAGYDVEITAARLRERLPRQNLIVSADFDVPLADATFDFVLAQSLFTHLSFNRIRQCLERTARLMRPHGVLYATYFELPPGAVSSQPHAQPPLGIVTHGAQDPFHYHFRDLQFAAPRRYWTARPVGNWNHPRGQLMAAFERREDDRSRGDETTRRLPADLARTQAAGAEHYRAYVGPPDRFDFMSATQFNLLFSNGLREHHRLLDFGCGSLRLGRLAIPYLRENCYFGIEPNRWLIDDAITYELGQDIVDIKKPTFSQRADFDCDVFGTTFDYIIAQSIVTHCGPDLFAKLVASASRALRPDGLVLLSVVRSEAAQVERAAEGWHYPQCVAYTDARIRQFFADAGLQAVAIPWYHPGANWYLGAATRERLPSEADCRGLTGMVLHEPQFAASRARS